MRHNGSLQRNIENYNPLVALTSNLLMVVTMFYILYNTLYANAL